jgi:hypothetical protein
LPRGNDFLETLPVALVELKGFVEPSPEIVGAPLLRELVLEAARAFRDRRITAARTSFQRSRST